MKHIILFASGSGTNVENIVKYFEGHSAIAVSCVFTNKRDAFVIDRCNAMGVPAFSFNGPAFKNGSILLQILKNLKPDLIVLAGFLRKIPSEMVADFPEKIINIHPALLPKYGGKGMYGKHVHREVKANKEKESGITVHYVNDHYDEGAIIEQRSVSIASSDSEDEIARKVQELEHLHYPRIIEAVLTEN
ncbi:phosphoribosylglycinamide formyltransferase [Muriicola soli]|uniref:Phosphoribosylglycinamide formyltransferase n=1 Tax=Muriicola soli TaxID=2507538 RepID=A0A411ECN0_9FLAO|nr:phosphoribosylglycinamide formyltransferase [Muriicola soli]QBA65263.1 phosphoribosylglycinamide formyltransferase [Muriicola soli]